MRHPLDSSFKHYSGSLLPQRQKGVVAIGVALILLLLVTMGTLYVSRTVTVEQRVSANLVRAKLALEAADAGMNFALTFMDVDDRDLDDNTFSDRSDMMLALTGSRTTDDLADDSGMEFDGCDANGDGDCGDDLATPITLPDGTSCDEEKCSDTGYWLQAVWADTDGDGVEEYEWSTSTSACNTPARICLQLKMGDERYQVKVVSTGFSDDGLGVKQVSQTVRRVNPFSPGIATHPLITFSKVKIGGSMTVVNVFSNATIWAGGQVEGFGAGGSSQRGTLIHPNADGPQVYNDSGELVPFFNPTPPFTYDASMNLLDITNVNSPYDPSDLTKSSGGSGSSTYLGPDVIDNSADLADSKAADPDAFFENFFNGPADFIKESADYVTSDDRLADPDGEHSVNGSFIWVDTGGEDFSLRNGTYGSPEEPVLLVIDGNLDMGAAPTIYGQLYVRGDVVGGGAGGGLIFGSAIIEGDNGMDESGGFDVIYEPNILSRAGGGVKNIAVAFIPGTWKDWQ